jgi:hypothetical protein
MDKPRIKEERGHGVLLSTKILKPKTPNPFSPTTIDMSAVNTLTSHINRSPERVGSGLVNGYQWKPAHGLGLISHSIIRRPQNDRFDEGPYLSCEQVGAMVDSSLIVFC